MLHAVLISKPWRAACTLVLCLLSGLQDAFAIASRCRSRLRQRHHRRRSTHPFRRPCPTRCALSVST